MTIQEDLTNLKNDLDKLTLKELIMDNSIQEDLQSIVLLIQDFLFMINPRKRSFIINIDEKENARGKI